MFLWTDSTWRKCRVSEDDAVLAALSGGADSVALLLELLELQRNGLIGGIAAAHLNHGIRGQEADEDEAFVRSLCDSLGIRLIVKRVDVPASAKRSGVSLELAARCERYAFLSEAKTEAGCDVIALGHHRDDQAETVLLHLLRGSGTDGLAGMRLRSGDLIRPLLLTGKDEILAFLAERGQPYRIDSTNLNADATRNRIRLNVMPVLETINPQARKALSDAAFRIAEDADYLGSLADEAFTAVGYDRKKLAALPRPVRLRVLKRMLPYDDCTSADLLRLESLLSGQTGDRATLKNGVVAWLDASGLRFDRIGSEPFRIPLGEEGTYRLPNGTLTVRTVEKPVLPCGGCDAYIDADRIAGDVFVRSPLPGDRFTPFGMLGSRLLSDYLTDRKIPRFERNVPLICDEEGILFVAGHTIDNRVRIDASTAHIRHYHYEED